MEMLPFLDLKPQYQALQQQIQGRLNQVMEHGQFILGPEVQECEQALARYIGARHCLTVASGTDALLMALMALGIGRDDEVITTPFSFFATAEVISLLGAKPVFVDIDPVTYNLNFELIEKAITPRTRAIMPVSLYGQPADFKEINQIAQAHRLTVIEDAAQSFGAPYQGEKSCHLTDVSATSFFPAKPLGCYGDGGAVFTDNDELLKKLKCVRVHGQESRYRHVAVGINGRLDTLQCAILIEKLTRYEWEISQRQRIAQRYNQAFAPLSDRLKIPTVKSDRQSVWAQYTVGLQGRDRFAKELAALGIPTSVHYPIPLHWQPVYQELKSLYHLPEAEKAAAEVISLPIYPDMTEAVQDRIILAVQEVLSR